MTDCERIQDALEVARRHGGHDGAHHKDWVIDQMVRALTGDQYEAWVAETCEMTLEQREDWDTIDDKAHKMATEFAKIVHSEVEEMANAWVVDTKVASFNFVRSSGLVSLVLFPVRVSAEALRWYTRALEKVGAL